jgi:hypothetical protein
MRYVSIVSESLATLLLVCAFAAAAPAHAAAQSSVGASTAGLASESVASSVARAALAPVIVTVGRDPNQLLKFVLDNIAQQTYSGSLRDPRSVLIARSANSPDAARYLVALLEHAGHEACIVKFEFPPQNRSSQRG